jgi:hypothetical protein
VLALDKALKKREADTGVPLTHDDLGEFTQVPMWSRDGLGPDKAPGMQAPCCGHCAPITNGTHNPAGNAPRKVYDPVTGKWPNVPGS